MYETVKMPCRISSIVLAVFAISLFVLPTVVCALQPLSSDEGGMVVSTASKRLQTRITFSCRDLPIDTVLMQLAEQAKLDIIKSPKVTGKVTVKITNVPLEEALSNILASHGYTYIATENMIRVIPQSDIPVITQSEKLVTRIYRITYADVKEVESALKGFISKKGAMSLNKGTSNIMVTDTESKIWSIDRFIEEIDRITPQVLVEVRIYDITTNEGFEFGQAWWVARNTPLTAIDRESSHTESTVDSSGTTEFAVDPVTGVITKTVIPAIPVTTITDTETISQEDTTQFKSKPWMGGGYSPDSGGVIAFSVFNDAIRLEYVLQALQEEVKIELLANPRLLVLDNERATFKIVREIPYIDLSQTSQGGEMTTIKFKEVGVKLDVTPHITREGMIRMRIRPEFGVHAASPLTNLNTPEVNTRCIDTTTLVKDGQTVALGGLRKKDSREIINKMPFFGDLPILGGLFRSRATTEEVVELVIFITPRIVVEPTLTQSEQEKFDATEFKSSEKMAAKTK